MEREIRTLDVNYPPITPPTTVQELIDLLAIFPLDHKISFGTLTLFQLKDRGDYVSFEFNEDFKITSAP